MMTETATAGFHLPPIRIIRPSDLRASDEPGAEGRFGKDNKRYKPVEGLIELETNYRRDYDKKPIPQTKVIRHDRIRINPGRFAGHPSYRDDYIAYAIQSGGRVLRPSEYRPPSKKFEGSSVYAAEFVPHHIQPFRNAKPIEKPQTSEEPFPSSTSYRDTFIGYPPQEVWQPADRPPWQPNPTPLTAVTNYQTDYPTKNLSPTASCKPNTGPYQSGAPFEGTTTQKDSYVGYQVEKPFARERVTYRRPDVEMDFFTTTSTDFTRKPLEKVEPKRPNAVRESFGTFDGTTHYETEFRTWPMGERTKAIRKGGYTAPDAPFSGEPTYKRDYVQYDVTARCRDHRPNEAPLRTDEPFPTNTQYRDNYVAYQVTPRQTQEKPAWLPNTSKLDSVTNYQSDFVARELCKTDACRPEARPVRFDDSATDYATTHVTSFTPWKFVNNGGMELIPGVDAEQPTLATELGAAAGQGDAKE